MIAYSPLAQGFNHIVERDSSGAVESVAAITGKTPAQIALNWCISKENVVAIPKANSVAHVEEDCEASGWRLSSEHLSLLEMAFQ